MCILGLQLNVCRVVYNKPQYDSCYYNLSIRLTKQWRLYDIAAGSGTLCIILDIDNLQDIASHSVRNTAPVRYRVS